MYILRPIVFFAALSSAAVVPERRATVVDTKTILDDLTACEKSVQGVINALNGFTGGLLGLVQVGVVTTAWGGLTTSAAKATADVLLSSQLSSADSKKVVDQVNATLAIDNPKTCTLLKSKRPLYDGYHLRAAVQLTLISVLTQVESLNSALVNIMSNDYKDKMTQVGLISTVAVTDCVNYYAITAK
jgi:hypothetical protein